MPILPEFVTLCWERAASNYLTLTHLEVVLPRPLTQIAKKQILFFQFSAEAVSLSCPWAQISVPYHVSGHVLALRLVYGVIVKLYIIF